MSFFIEDIPAFFRPEWVGVDIIFFLKEGEVELDAEALRGSFSGGVRVEDIESRAFHQDKEKGIYDSVKLILVIIGKCMSPWASLSWALPKGRMVKIQYFCFDHLINCK